MKKWVFFKNSLRSGGSRKIRGSRRAVIGCDLMEDRIVLSHSGLSGMLASIKPGMILPSLIGNLMSKVHQADMMRSLSELGVLPILGNIGGNLGAKPTPIMGGSPLQDNLKTAMDKMKTDLQALATKSSVTIADMTALMDDGFKIAMSGVKIDGPAIENVMNQMARAVAGGTSTDDAKTAFNALFAGSKVSQETIDKTFADLINIMSKSNLTIADLDLIAADRAAIETARKALADAGVKPPVMARPDLPPVAAKPVPVTTRPLQGRRQIKPMIPVRPVKFIAKPAFGKYAGRRI
jgi:hypothetical protein